MSSIRAAKMKKSRGVSQSTGEGRRGGGRSRSSGRSISNDANELNTDEKINNNKKSNNSVESSPKKICIIIAVVVGFLLVTTAGVTTLVPLVRFYKVELYLNSTTWVYNEDAYQQHSSIRDRVHSHWMGDCLGREEYGSVLETYTDKNGSTKKKKCWFCQRGCAIASYLHMKKLEPNQENICNPKYMNNQANFDWNAVGYDYGEPPHDDCFGKIKGESHFVHIKKVNYSPDNKIVDFDVFDSNGGNKKMKMRDFQSFIVKMKKNE